MYVEKDPLTKKGTIRVPRPFYIVWLYLVPVRTLTVFPIPEPLNSREKQP